MASIGSPASAARKRAPRERERRVVALKKQIGGDAWLEPSRGGRPGSACAARAIKASLSAKCERIGDERGDERTVTAWVRTARVRARRR